MKVPDTRAPNREENAVSVYRVTELIGTSTESWEKAAAAAPSILSCYMMSGQDDYLIIVLARDLADFERIHKEQLSRLPGVSRLHSSFVLREVTSRSLPVSSLLR